MNHIQIERDLSEITQSENGCQYTDIEDGFVVFILGNNSKHCINVLHLKFYQEQAKPDNAAE